MSNKEWMELIVANHDKIVEKIIECDKWNAKFQNDVLLYHDGDVYFFPNVGGNSFKTGKHDVYITICSINNEYNEENKEDIEENDYVEWAEMLIGVAMDNLEYEMKNQVIQ